MAPQFRLVSLFSFVALACALLALYMGRPGTTVVVENLRGPTLRQVTLQIAPVFPPSGATMQKSGQIYELGDIPAGDSRGVYLGPTREATIWFNSVDLVTGEHRSASRTSDYQMLKMIWVEDGKVLGHGNVTPRKSILLRFVTGVFLTGTWVMFAWRRSRPRHAPADVM